MAHMAVPGIINGAWVNDVSKAIVPIPAWAERFNADQHLPSGGAFTISPWANRCITIRMNSLSKIPWEIRKNDEPLDRSDIGDLFEESRLVDLLRLSEADLCLVGRAFWLKGFSGNTLVGLRRLNASTMTVHKSSQGVTRFEQRIQGRPTLFSPEEIVYFHEYDPVDDLDGVALVRVAEMAIQAEYNADRYITAFFRNYALPNVVFSTEADLPQSEAEKAEAWWKRRFSGVLNQFKAGFLGRGLKPNVISFSPDKLALTEVREEARRSICATFGVPPTVANASDPGSYATADEQRQSLYEETIVPRAEWYAEHINEQIVHLHRTDMDFAFNIEALPTLQEDGERMAKRLALLVDTGIITHEAAAAEAGYGPDEIGSGRRLVSRSRRRGGGGEAPEEEPEVKAVLVAPPLALPAPAVPEEAVDSTDDMLSDLRRWRKKSARLVKAGKSPACDFESEFIGASMTAAIQGQLDAVDDAEGVRDVFDRVERELNANA